ncbi:MarR family winged helix-turn-helix transcriptional regulator [Schaalia sp. ZJ405]|uniref:MarR family winged helix-turn-helix transcriptional regulator n=1 Tax=Schaalia sp. ZJ405 TaxID=2709403 RepID=UPI001E52CFFB|nr:MarR family transcriptional regulator [Schaalia sp. ZJ405]
MTTATPDEVDRIVAAWTQERPDLDVAPMRILSRITRIARHLDLKRREAFATHNLEPWEFDVLSSLRRSGPPYSLTPGALMTELLVSSGTMTNRIDRLEQRSLVSRTPSPVDRRAVLVALTDDGKMLVDQALQALLEVEREILASVPDSDMTDFASLLRSVLVPLESTATPSK